MPHMSLVISPKGTGTYTIYFGFTQYLNNAYN